MEKFMEGMLREFGEMKSIVVALEQKILSLEEEKNRNVIMEEASKNVQTTGVQEVNANVTTQKVIESEDTLLLRMKKSCNIEPYQGSRVMGVLE